MDSSEIAYQRVGPRNRKESTDVDEQRKPRLRTASTMSSSQSSYYHSVQKILSHVTAATLKQFSNRQTDDERISFILEQHGIDDLFDCKPIHEAKSADESKKCREKGNIHYQKQEYKAALVWYSKSVIWAPHPDFNQNESAGSEELPLALGNRSATLYQLRRYEEAIVDIDLAFKYRFPAHIQYKLYDRKGRCQQEMGNIDEALECFAKVKDVLCKTKLNDKQKDKIVLNSNKQIKNCKVNGDILENGSGSLSGQSSRSSVVEDIEVPKLERTSKRFPCASEWMDVKYTAAKGRYAMATSNVTVGSFVLKEKPYSAVLDPSLYLTRCFHCFKYLVHEAIPCQQCITVRYCSDACRGESWDRYHRWECRHLGLLTSSGTGYIAQLALKTVITTGIPLILKCKRNPKSEMSDAQKALFTDSKGVYMGGFIGLYNLLTHTKGRSTNDLLNYAILAVFLAKILDQSGFLSTHPNERKESLMTCIGAVLLRFLQIISCNGVEVSEMVKGTTLQKCNPESIGLCLYPTVSLINHSCNPALELVFYNNVCMARAIRNIAEGQELTIDYGYIYYVTPKPQRQMFLQSQYFFDCQCEPCKFDWPLKAGLKSDIPVLKCIECFTPLALFGNKDPTRVECRKCRLVQNPLEYFDTLRTSSQAFEKAVERARLFDIKETLPILEEHLILMDTHLHQPWKEYTTCVSTIKQIYRLEANVRKSVTEHSAGF